MNTDSRIGIIKMMPVTKRLQEYAANGTFGEHKKSDDAIVDHFELAQAATRTSHAAAALADLDGKAGVDRDPRPNEVRTENKTLEFQGPPSQPKEFIYCDESSANASACSTLSCSTTSTTAKPVRAVCALVARW